MGELGYYCSLGITGVLLPGYYCRGMGITGVLLGYYWTIFGFFFEPLEFFIFATPL